MPVHRPLDVKGAILALVLAVLWGANPVAIKLGLADVAPVRMAFFRFAVSAIVIFGYAVVTGRRDVLLIPRGQGKPIWSLGLLCVVQIALMNVGIDRTTAAHAVIMVNSYAVHTVVFAHFLLPGDRLTGRKLVGVLIAYSGVVILFAPGFTGTGGALVGDLIIAVSALVLAERTVFIAKTVQRVDPVRLMMYQSIIGAAGLFLMSLVWDVDRPTRWTAGLLLSILYQGALIGGFNFVLNAKLLRIYQPSAMATVALSTPIWGVLIAAAIGREGLAPELVLASAMVAAGIGLTTRR
ncbi:MAG TPA: DMT family transporter [Methylomirabilota bacterium]|nr:DMT family transporter [Methylomirabilota bacterium]